MTGAGQSTQQRGAGDDYWEAIELQEGRDGHRCFVLLASRLSAARSRADFSGLICSTK